MIPIHHKVEVLPFNTPSYVTVKRVPSAEDLRKEVPSFPIAELSVETQSPRPLELKDADAIVFVAKRASEGSLIHLEALRKIGSLA